MMNFDPDGGISFTGEQSEERIGGLIEMVNAGMRANDMIVDLQKELSEYKERLNQMRMVNTSLMNQIESIETGSQRQVNLLMSYLKGRRRDMSEQAQRLAASGGLNHHEKNQVIMATISMLLLFGQSQYAGHDYDDIPF